MLQAHQWLYASFLIIKQGITVWAGGDEGAGQAFGVPAQSGAAMNRGGDVHINGHSACPAAALSRGADRLCSMAFIRFTAWFQVYFCRTKSRPA